MNLNLLIEGKCARLKSDLISLLKSIDDLPDHAKEARDQFVKNLDEYIEYAAIRNLNITEKKKLAKQGLISSSGFDLHQAAYLAQKNNDWKSFGEFMQELGRRYKQQGYRQPKID